MDLSFDASIAWARTHMTFVLDDIASEKAAAQRIPHYERLMAQYPELVPACQSQVNQIERFLQGEAQSSVAALPVSSAEMPDMWTQAPPPVPDDEDDDEEDLPF